MDGTEAKVFLHPPWSVILLYEKSAPFAWAAAWCQSGVSLPHRGSTLAVSVSEFAHVSPQSSLPADGLALVASWPVGAKHARGLELWTYIAQCAAGAFFWAVLRWGEGQAQTCRSHSFLSKARRFARCSLVGLNVPGSKTMGVHRRGKGAKQKSDCFFNGWPCDELRVSIVLLSRRICQIRSSGLGAETP
ncbi:hypothetical protein CISG_04327 [Coccidioides immitis RMSCC 3703]|uniref:Uncharacterized protein n=1 Tax=Coccidioides immitis RMSCC 3703 TaxID=454286 RepID=A0A0J8QSK6_COCIT|nr:hypothetical protein CISG_04327 [Coccidioides immitis RMSCC 3703]